MKYTNCDFFSGMSYSSQLTQREEFMRVTERLLRKLNEFEIERDLARYFSEDGDPNAAAECFKAARMIMHEIEKLFLRATRASSS
ncbi:MAG: hypothetical protein A2854_00090 [Parcubacteria group bacterium RIFCSPHIGHO2_01_FULL_56_18]|nr:MAG: hypothetical protein A2854_00090 [Parcubacteria group bacterium RIFCSPHIGHO2_01_FULL_56_18]